MTGPNDGGPAFPHLNPNYDGNWDKEPQRGGMSLRDWFAGQVLNGYLAHQEALHIASADPLIAKYAYDLAEAMLAERRGR